MKEKYVLCKSEELECLRIKVRDLLETLDAILASAPRGVRMETPFKRSEDLEIAAMLARLFVDAMKADEKG